tara:strand:- start:1829 stop:2530 length:702 start_codon:yes stop_codon:yes gene_type:complete
MNCLEFRILKLAEPYRASEEAVLHASECPGCSSFKQEIHELDDSLRTAFSVEVPEGLAAKVLLNQSLKDNPRRPTRRYWLSLAASFLVAITMMPFLPMQSLDAEIITHLDHEVHQVHGKSGDIGSGEVRNVLLAVSGETNGSLGTVTYASKCLMNGQLVAHFVVENGGETYTLMLIPEKIDSPLPFQSERWQGLVIPHSVGSLAIIATRQAESSLDFLRLAEQYSQSINHSTI